MPIALIAGPVVALIGVVAVFFVLRRKSVEKRSMYSARRSQIEHKVRAARQRTLAPHGHAEKPTEAPAEAAPPFAVPPGSQATSYAPPAYEPPPAPPPPPPGAPEAAPVESPWGTTPPGSSPFGGPAAPPAYEPAAEQYQTPPEPPAYQPPAGEAAWTPASAPPAPAPPVEPAPAPAPVTTSAGGGASWSIVGDAKDMTGGAGAESGRGKERGPGGSWQLASGEAPGSEAEEVVKPPSAAVAIAQYAILVVGLVMVLIGVFVMIANSHVS